MNDNNAAKEQNRPILRRSSEYKLWEIQFRTMMRSWESNLKLKYLANPKNLPDEAYSIQRIMDGPITGPSRPANYAGLDPNEKDAVDEWIKIQKLHIENAKLQFSRMAHACISNTLIKEMPKDPSNMEPHELFSWFESSVANVDLGTCTRMATKTMKLPNWNNARELFSRLRQNRNELNKIYSDLESQTGNVGAGAPNTTALLPEKLLVLMALGQLPTSVWGAVITKPNQLTFEIVEKALNPQLQGKSREEIMGTKRPAPDHDLKKTFYAKKQQRFKLTERQTELMKAGKCWTCEKPGHLARNCKEKANENDDGTDKKEE